MCILTLIKANTAQGCYFARGAINVDGCGAGDDELFNDIANQESIELAVPGSD